MDVGLKPHFWWRISNRLRRAFGRSALPKRCCRKRENRVPHAEPGFAQGVTVQKCAVCGCRHFEALAEPGRFNARLA